MPDNLSATLANLEVTRQAALSTMKKWGGIALAAGLALAAVLYLGGSNEGAFIAAIAGVVIAGGLVFYQQNKVKSEFKQKIMPVLLAGVDPSLRYTMNGRVTEAEFDRADLFMKPDRFSGKDLVEGKIGETAVKFSLVHAEEEYTETERDSDGDTRTVTKYRTIFRGLFFVADFNKHFNGRTKVVPHGIKFLEKLSGSHVELEDPEFAKLFNVTSTDQVEARYILSPSLMDRFKALHARVGTVRTAFIDEHMLMAIDMPYSAFEPSVMKPLTESGQVEKVLGNLKSVTGIVGDLGLNTRIWTKV
jgi:hypothetical protein